MDRSRIDRNRTQRCGNYQSVTESEYDVVDDEDVLRVHILPARPLNEEREYADRNLPRSASAQSLSSFSTGNSNIVPRCPPRKYPFIAGPAVNRDLKPGRRKTRLDERRRPVPPEDPDSLRRSPSPPSFACRRDRQKATRKGDINPRVRDLQSAEGLPPYANQRHSLDLETHQLDMRAQQDLERASSKRHHHEWPRTKEDFDQHVFIPMEKPQQTYCEEDWYVGACSRADAEHALHLVNKDGAFLVRDCSAITNSEPLVLAVYHEKKVYNVKIRFMQNISKYALGTGQRSNDMFDTVADIIKFHSIFPIILISGRTMPSCKYPENCVLTCPVTKKDVDLLLQ